MRREEPRMRGALGFAAYKSLWKAALQSIWQAQSASARLLGQNWSINGPVRFLVSMGENPQQGAILEQI